MRQLGVLPHAFLMAVAIAASMAFATPVASPVNTLVMGAGNYRFVDYIITLKEAEIARYLSDVTDWEHREYFELF